MIKQNPFSIYDFLGYFIPGSIFIYAYLIMEFIRTHRKFKLNDIINDLEQYGVEQVFLFIILAYTIGHILGFVSSLTVENYANWKYSYPSKYLLNISHPGYWKSAVHWKDTLWRIFIVIGLFPIFIFDFLLGYLLGFKSHYKKPLDDKLVGFVRYKIKLLLTRIGMKRVDGYTEQDALQIDFHRLVTHFAYEYSKSHQAKMSNYVALYGFLRTLCLIFNVITLYILITALVIQSINLETALIAFFIGFICYILFMAFMKFYRRYTLEGFMIISILDVKNENQED